MGATSCSQVAIIAASLAGAGTLDAFSGGTGAVRRKFSDFTTGDENNEEPDWWTRDTGHRLPFYHDLRREGRTFDDEEDYGDMPPKAAAPRAVRPKR